MTTAKVKNRYIPPKHFNWWITNPSDVYLKIFDSTDQSITLYYGPPQFEITSKYVVNFT